ncbi:MAG: hypothetical protein ACRC1W_01270 [Shewanella sp.]
MKVISIGHCYELANFENKEEPGQLLQFIHKVPVGISGLHPGQLRTICDGTTNEEVISALIDRMLFLQSNFPCKENACCITHLEEALMWLEKRTRDREKRNVEGKHLQ